MDDPIVITGLTSQANGGDASVNEANLSDGSSPNIPALTQAGSFSVSAPDGLQSVSVGGIPVIVDGAFVGGSATTPLGNTLTITGFNPATGEITYTYTLNDNEFHDKPANDGQLFEDFPIVVTDEDGDTGSDTLTIRILDDLPQAADDAGSVG